MLTTYLVKNITKLSQITNAFVLEVKKKIKYQVFFQLSKIYLTNQNQLTKPKMRVNTSALVRQWLKDDIKIIKYEL